MRGKLVKSIAGGALAAAIAGGSLVLAGAVNPASATPASAQTDQANAGFPTTQAQADRDLASVWPQPGGAGAANLPRILLPPDQRKLWIAAWDDMATCMHEHGEGWFPRAPATFGDGHTPPPVVGGPPGSASDVTTPGFEAAQAACPFDTSALDMQELQQAEFAAAVAATSGTGTVAPPGR